MEKEDADADGGVGREEMKEEGMIHIDIHNSFTLL
jgi:hypothetical protein